MWFILATCASILWGLTYVIDEQLFKKISVQTTLLVQMLALAIFIAALATGTGSIRRDLAKLGSDGKLSLLLLIGTATFAIAELCIGYSINGKSATLASLVEISYPLFSAIFAFLLFREGELNVATALGGVLICGGVFIVYFAAR